MSIVIEEIVEKAREIPIILDGKDRRMGDLEGDKVYETVMKHVGGEKRIYFGEKTRQGIAIHLFHMGIVDSLSLNSLSYTLYLKSPEQEGN